MPDRTPELHLIEGKVGKRGCKKKIELLQILCYDYYNTTVISALAYVVNFTRNVRWRRVYDPFVFFVGVLKLLFILLPRSYNCEYMSERQLLRLVTFSLLLSLLLLLALLKFVDRHIVNVSYYFV